MDYIILKSDGSLQTSSLNRYIMQGSTGVDKIFIGWADALATDVVDVIFTLPNQTTKAEVYTQTYESNYNYDGEHTSKGWVVTLYSAETTYNGLLFAALRVIRGGIVQVCYPFTLVINETGVRPDADSGVTIEELDSYLVNIETLVGNAVRDNTDSQLSNTSENPVQNKVVKQAIDDAIAGVYKVQGSTYVASLNGLTKAESLNGNVYNMLDSGTLTNSTDTISVQEGDNVVFVWNEGTWYWDRLAGIVDTSNLLTKNTDQDISSTKTFDNLKEVRFKAINSGHYFYLKADGNIFHIGAVGVATSLVLDTYLTKFIPTTTGQQELGSNDNKWKTLYLSHYVAWGNNVLIGKDSSNRFYVTGSDGNTKIKVGVNETYFAQHVEPDSSNTYDLGRSGMYWRKAYIKDIIDSNGNSIATSDIATKSDPADAIDLGTFDANGEITYDIATLQQDLSHLGYDSVIHGLYMLTYLYAQAIIYLDETQLSNAALLGAPVRTAMPVVYDALNSQATAGNLRVKKVGSNYVFKVSDGNQNAAQGQHMYLIPTNLIK